MPVLETVLISNKERKARIPVIVAMASCRPLESFAAFAVSGMHVKNDEQFAEIINEVWSHLQRTSLRAYSAPTVTVFR